MTGVDPKGLSQAAFEDKIEAIAHRWAIASYNKALGRTFEDIDAIKVELRRALTPLKGAPVAWANATDEWFLALDCEDNVYCATQDHGEAIAALSRLHDYERGRIERLVPAPEAEVCSASQPLPETEEKALAREEILHAFFGAGKDIVKAGGGAPSRWDYRKLQDAWQAARDLLARGDAA